MMIWFLFIITLFVLVVSLFSPAEMQSFLGAPEPIALALGYFLLLFVTAGGLSIHLFKRSFIDGLACAITLSGLVGIPTFIFYFGIGPQVIFSFEHTWDRFYAIKDAYSCHVACADDRFVHANIWGGGLGGGECIDRLFHVESDNAEHVRAFVRQNMPDDAPGTGTTAADIRSAAKQYYSAISCSM